MDRPECIRTRFLKLGEHVDFSEIGVDGVRLMGSHVQVAEHEDGLVSVCMMPLSVLRVLETYVFATLVLYREARYGAREVHFLRVIAEMTLASLAPKLRMTAEELRAVEKGTQQLNQEQVTALRGIMVPVMGRLLNSLPERSKHANRQHLHRAQEVVNEECTFEVDAPTSSFMEAALNAEKTLLGDGMWAQYSNEVSGETACIGK